MSLNARMSPSDNRLYNPGRDLAHCFGAVMTEVARRCEIGTWDALQKLAVERDVTDDEIGQACQALCRFVATQADDPRESMASGLARCQWLEIPPYARVIVMAYMGTVVLGMSWAGVREATLGGAGPAQTYGNLRWHGMRCAKLMRMPRWRRRLYNFWGRCRRAWRAFNRTDLYS